MGIEAAAIEAGRIAVAASAAAPPAAAARTARRDRTTSWAGESVTSPSLRAAPDGRRQAPSPTSVRRVTWVTPAAAVKRQGETDTTSDETVRRRYSAICQMN